MGVRSNSELAYRASSLPWAIKHETGMWRIEGYEGFFMLAPHGGSVDAFIPETRSVEEFWRIDDEQALARAIKHRRLEQDRIYNEIRISLKDISLKSLAVDWAKNSIGRKIQ